MGKLVNGTYYLSLEDDGIDSNEEIRKVVIPEGITTLGVCYITRLQNLEEIEFPSTLSLIGGSAITQCPKLTADGLKFKNNNFYLQAPNSINNVGYSPIMKDYKNKMRKVFLDKNTSFEEKCAIYSQIILTMTEEEQMEFSKDFEREFAKNNYNIDFLISKIMNGELLSTADLQCFSLFIQKMMNMQAHPIILQYINTKVACARPDKIVSVGYSSLVSTASRNIPDRNDIVLTNTFMLYAILHEFQHIRQHNNSEGVNFGSNDLLSQIDYIDSTIQTTADSFGRGYGYSNFHDLSPDEIRADLDAYDLLISFISSLEPTDTTSRMIAFIEERKINRIKAAHQIDENGNVAIYDYRVKAFDELLGRDNLSTTEREKLNKLRELYVVVLEEAAKVGIDFFANEIDYYKNKSKSNEL